MSAKNDIDDYISNCDGKSKDYLEQIYAIFMEIIPESKQKISWGMPTLKFGKHNACHFAAFKKHVSLFPSSYVIEHFAEKLQPYKTSKGTIQFQHNELLPVELIREIAIWRKKFMLNNPEKG